MDGKTPIEAARAVKDGGHAAAFGLALAELSMYWDKHPKGRPDMHEPRLNIRIDAGGAPEDRIEAVRQIADWLGVEVNERYGVYHAQRRFGTGEDSIIVEAHFTPDQDATHKMIRDAVKRREAVPEAAGREPVGAAALWAGLPRPSASSASR